MKYKDFKQMSFAEMQTVLGGYANPIEGGGACAYSRSELNCSCGSGWTNCKCQANDPLGGHCVGDNGDGCYHVGMGAQDCPKTA